MDGSDRIQLSDEHGHHHRPYPQPHPRLNIDQPYPRYSNDLTFGISTERGVQLND